MEWLQGERALDDLDDTMLHSRSSIIEMFTSLSILRHHDRQRRINRKHHPQEEAAIFGHSPADPVTLSRSRSCTPPLCLGQPLLPFPCVHACHPCIDCLAPIRKLHGGCSPTDNIDYCLIVYLV
jgi:hypothetical protein